LIIQHSARRNLQFNPSNQQPLSARHTFRRYPSVNCHTIHIADQDFCLCLTLDPGRAESNHNVMQASETLRLSDFHPPVSIKDTHHLLLLRTFQEVMVIRGQNSISVLAASSVVFIQDHHTDILRVEFHLECQDKEVSRQLDLFRQLDLVSQEDPSHQEDLFLQDLVLQDLCSSRLQGRRKNAGSHRPVLRLGRVRVPASNLGYGS
jgi:hypothetical protein